MFAPGEVVLGKYRIERVLGEGGMGVVMLAQHTQLDQRVALKFMTLGATLEPAAAGRFQREARAVAKLRGENVARVLDVDTLPDGTAFIVMEYLEGRDLSEVTAESPLSVTDAVDYVLQASVALAEAHAQGIVHRDLKPANLFLTHKPDGSPLIKVLDFGISKLRSEDEPSALTTRTGTVMGSPLFMPPEQARSAKDVDHRADIWALGAVLYQLIGHRPPFHADNFADLFVKILHERHEPLSTLSTLGTLSTTIPPGIDAVIDRCLSKSPEQRYANLGELARALGPFASPEGARLVGSVLRLAGDPQTTQPGPVLAQDSQSVAVAEPTTAAIGPIAEAISGVGAGTQDALAVSATRPASRTPRLLLVAGAVVVGGVVTVAFTLRRPAQSLEPAAAGSAPEQAALSASVAESPASSPSIAPALESAALPTPSAAPEPSAAAELGPSKPTVTRETTARADKPKPKAAAPVAKSSAPSPEKSAAPTTPKPPPTAKPDPFGTMQ